MEPNTLVATSLHEAFAARTQTIADIQAAKPTHLESCVNWLGRTISTWPNWLSTPTFSLVKHLGIRSGEEQERKELQQKMINDVKHLILEYKIPADIIDAVREEMKNRNGRFGKPLSATLQKAFTDFASYIPLVDLLDLHGIVLIPHMEQAQYMDYLVKTQIFSPYTGCSIELRALALQLPHIQRINLANCSLNNLSIVGSSHRIITTITDPALFPHVEEIDLSHNGLVLVMQNVVGAGLLDPDAPREVLIPDLMRLPNLKRLIVTGNICTQAEIDAAHAQYPHLQIILKQPEESALSR